jgi:hypothetical protein
MTDPKRSWFDGTVNLPTILSVVVAAGTACVFAVTTYNGIEHRVTILEQHDIQATENRGDVRQSLQDINTKLDKLNDKLIASSAGNRPDMQRWSK